MSIRDKAEALIDFYSKITGLNSYLNGWIVRQMAISEIERLISELKEIDFNYALEDSDKDSCLANTSIPYYESVIEYLKDNY